MFFKNMKLCMITSAVLGLGSCASHDQSKTKPKIHHRGYEDKWDHDQIRRNQEVEKAEAPTDMELDQASEEATNSCNVMTKDQMVRAKAQGCTPIDDRAGLGASMYCCPKE